MTRSLSQTISDLIAGAYTADGPDEAYQQNFADEGQRKADYIIADLRWRESLGLLNPASLALLSIGGSDGSEIEQILTETSISKAVMIEISPEAVMAARERARRLGEVGKDFVVIEGDATARQEDALSVAEAWCKSGEVEGLICSAQAVLHELPTRSPTFDLATFLGQLYRHSGWRVAGFYSREPSVPTAWPAAVRIRLPGVEADDLVRFARFVADRLKIDGAPKALASRWVSMPSVLAIESLHKLIRGASLRRIEYELGEQLTGFDPFKVRRHLESMVDGMKVSVQHVLTQGFRQALIDHQVEYVGSDSQPLPFPQTHAEVIGFAGSSTPVEKPAIKAPPPPPSGHKYDALEFKNPFGTAVSNESIAIWLTQFEPDERPIIAQLLAEFEYVSYARAKRLSQDLHERLVALLGRDFEKAIYVGLGGTGKSGEFVSYLHRTTNDIPLGRFVRAEQITAELVLEHPVILLDDILASGHQALQQWREVFEARLPDFPGQIVLASLVSCEAGEQFIQERTSLVLQSALPLARSREPLSADSTMFRTDIERAKARKILLRYGQLLAPRHPFGYGGAGLLLAFEHGTPDNCLPIFWSTAEGWIPLLHKGSPPRGAVNTHDTA